jgi:carboxyl-terminal processing protease
MTAFFPRLLLTGLALSLGLLGNPVQATPASAPSAASQLSAEDAPLIALEDNPKAVVDEVWQIVNQEFVDKGFNHTNWLTKRGELLRNQYGNQKEAYRTINKLLKQLGDPYTRFLSPADFSQLTSQTAGEVSGVGLRLVLDKRSNELVVADALRNTPAAKAGIRPGDRLLRINGKPTALMNLEQASTEIQGEVGTEVTLQLSRSPQEIFTVTLQRVQIELDSVAYSVKKEGNLQVGYIRLDEFSSHAAEQMKKAIETLNQQQITGYVLDLRGNPGGLLFASVDIARMWMDQGEIVSTVDRKGGDRHFVANKTKITNLPLVVLVDKYSASASEILTGALKENGRATIVGTQTYGKGTVQSVHSLSDGSGLAVTIARYFPPSGTDINHKGISPDIYLELSLDQELRLRNDPSLMGTNADPQYIQAISVLQRYHPPTLSRGKMPLKEIGILPPLD